MYITTSIKLFRKNKIEYYITKYSYKFCVISQVMEGNFMGYNLNNIDGK